MRKSLFFCTTLALLALVSGCKKDLETVTLGVAIEQDSKMYINSDNTPYWNAGDQVYVNSLAYTIANPNGGSAQIPDVEASESYCVIFPASIVPSGSNISSGTVSVTLPERQKYEIVDGNQRVEIPMAGVSSSTNLALHNLCSILRVGVSNSTSAAVDIKSITVTANNAYLSGAATATISGGETDSIVATSSGSHSVTLAKADNTAMATIAASTTTATTFDIILPTFGASSTITVKVETTTGYQEFSTTNAYTLTNNQIISFNAQLSSIIQYTTARLVKGTTFNAAIPSDATAVRFEYNSSVNSGTLLSTSTSSYPIYGNLASDRRTWVVSTSADVIYAHSSCSTMFRGAYNSSSELYESKLTSIDFGNGFNTSNVTNMARMFTGCSGLTSLNVSSFNTSNVTSMGQMFLNCSGLTSLDVSNFNTSSATNMGSMFSGCSGLTSLNLSNFNTSSVTDMRFMFQNCSSLTSLNLYNFDMTSVTKKSSMCNKLATTSRACTITCPTAVQTELESGTSLPTHGVTFTWETH